MKINLLLVFISLFILQCERGWLKDIINPAVEGCTDDEACNYSSDATEDDGSCEYTLDCNGDICGEAIVDECGICNGNGPPCQDNIPPTVNIISPLSGTIVSGIVIIKVNAEDDVGIKLIVFLKDGIILLNDAGPSGDTEPPYEFEWDTTDTSPGDYTITVKAYDTSDNLTISQPIILTVQN